MCQADVVKPLVYICLDCMHLYMRHFVGLHTALLSQMSGTGFVACRPCGASTLLASYDKEGPQLYVIEPAGVALVSL